MKRLKSPYITSSESFLSQIGPTDSADEAYKSAKGMVSDRLALNV
jgi:hypothetical protein